MNTSFTIFCLLVLSSKPSDQINPIFILKLPYSHINLWELILFSLNYVFPYAWTSNLLYSWFNVHKIDNGSVYFKLRFERLLKESTNGIKRKFRVGGGVVHFSKNG